jgi:hypothetical protein
MRMGLAALAALLLTVAAARADDPWTPAEDWAWSQIIAGKTANFDDPCKASTAAPADETVWNEPCRSVRGAVLEQMLTRLPWRRDIPHQGIRIVGAHVRGNLDLTNAHVRAAVVLARSRIDGDVKLARARLDGLFALDGSVIAGEIDATGLESDSDISFADGRLLKDVADRIGGTQTLKALTLKNARIRGSLYFNGGHFSPQTLVLQRAHVDAEIQSSGARFDGLVFAGGMHIGVLSINAADFRNGASFSGSTIENLVDASDSSFAGSGLSLGDARVSGDVYVNQIRSATRVNLTGARVAGFVAMQGSVIHGPVMLDSALVGGDVSLDKTTRVEGPLTLTAARVEGAVRMPGTPLASDVDFGNAHVTGDIDLAAAAFAHGLALVALHADGNLRLDGAVVAGDLTASDMEIRHDLVLNRAARLHGDAILFGSHVANSVHMEQAVFDKGLKAANIQVGGDMLLQKAMFGGLIKLAGARIDGDLTLTGVQLGQLDLTGAAVGGTLSVDAATTWRPPETTALAVQPQLILVNAKVGGLQDDVVADEPCPTHKQPPQHRNGWPTWQTIELDGFAYGHLGASTFGSGDMQHRDACWWRWWLDRNPVFSSQPYVELAAVMSAHGDQDSAAQILYFGRVRETQVAWQGGHYLRWLLLVGLDVFAGFGIGTYTFYALAWIICLTVIGVVLLKRSPGGKKHSVWWRIGASLTRLLPGVELNKEFSDFFNDPHRKRLHGWHLFVFSSFVVVGWVLGLFLVAAMSGLTQHS